MSRWKDTTVEEIKNFFGIILYMGLVKYLTMEDHWSNDVLYKNSVVSSRNRFQLLLTCIHFVDNATADTSDRLYKIRNLINMTQERFAELYTPGETVALDESMIPFRGRLLFLQYIPSKTHKYGIKMYKICSPLGYTLRVKVYSGKEPRQEKSVAEGIVMELSEKYLGTGRTIVTDNL